MWALGVVLYECCTGRHPFEAQNEGALIRKIMKGVYPPVQVRACWAVPTDLRDCSAVNEMDSAPPWRLSLLVALPRLG